MFKNWRTLITLLLSGVMILSFQNCEPQESGNSNQFLKSEGNGDGYSGIEVIHPKIAESGSTISLRVRRADDTLADLQGYEFEILEGEAELNVYGRNRRALVTIGEDYVGSLLIQVTASNGERTIVEIQVVSPGALNAMPKNTSYGRSMVVSPTRVFVSNPKKRVEEAKQAGAISVFRYRQDHTELHHHQLIQNPNGEEGELQKFGQVMGNYRKDLLVSSSDLDQIFHYRVSEIEGKAKRKLVLIETYEMDNSVSFGSDIRVREKRMIVADKFANGERGLIHIYHRANVDETFAFHHTLELPSQYSRVGRSVIKHGSRLIVSALKDVPGQEEKQGVVLVVRTSNGEVLQEITTANASENYGRRNKIHKGNLLVRERRRATSGFQEFIDVYKFDSESERYSFTQKIVSPAGEVSNIGFGLNMDSNAGDDLFVAAPRANSPNQKNSGLIYTYKLNSETGMYRYTGFVSPNFSKYDLILEMGYSMKATRRALFISLRGIRKGKDNMIGSVQIVPFRKSASQSGKVSQ